VEANIHTMTNLFAQLGLPSGAADIQAFIKSHQPLADHIKLNDAPFWNLSQAEFLFEEVLDDSDWAGVIDELNRALRQSIP
jgi:hypothetical protein